MARSKWKTTKKAVSKIFADDNAKRQKLAVTPPASGLANFGDARALLQLHQRAGAVDESKQKQNQDTKETRSVESSDDNEDDASNDPPTRSAVDFFGGQPSGLRPRSSSSHAIGGGWGSSGQASGRVRAASTAAAGSNAKTSISISNVASKSRSQTTLGNKLGFAGADIDGRSQRVVDSIDKRIAEEVEPAYASVLCLEDDRLRVAVDKIEKKQLAEYCQNNAKECATALKTLGQVLNRIKACEAESAVQVQQEDVEKKIEVVNACLELMTSMTKQQSPGDFLELIDILTNAGAQMSNQLYLIQFQHQINQLLIFNDTEGACQKCDANGADVKDLLSRGCTQASIVQLVESVFLDSILVLATSGLSKTQQQTEPATNNPTKLAIASSIQALMKASEQPSFLARAIANRELEDFELLVSASVDPAKVISLVTRFDDYHDLPNQQSAFGPLGTFIFDGAIGKGLILNARESVRRAELELKTSERISEIEALGQGLLDVDWNPFNSSEAMHTLEELVSPFHKAVQDVNSEENPIFNATRRRASFKLTDYHLVLLQRFESTQSKVWSHLRDCTMRHCHAQISKDIITSAGALQKNGEVDLGSQEVGKVGLIELTASRFCLPETLVQHAFFGQRAAFGQGKNDHGALVTLMADVDSLTKEFFQLASCALVHSVQRLRDLHLGKTWATKEITGWRDYPKKLETFLEKQCVKGATKRPLAKETWEALSLLVHALDDVVSANQKQCYGAIKVLVDLFVEGKQVAEIQTTKDSIPQPTAKNKFFFQWLANVLEVVRCNNVAFALICATLFSKSCNRAV